MRSALRALAVVVLAGVPVSGPTIPSSAGAPGGCAMAGAVYQGSPSWAQDRVAAPRVWPSTRGDGITVALVSSGIDRGNGQLGGDRLLPAVDLLGNDAAAAGGRADCDGRGTFEAGLIAARPDRRTGFSGVAPGVRLLPVRVLTTTARPDGSDPVTVGGGPERIAAGIDAAVEAGARVVCVTVATPRGSPRLRDAVTRAARAGALVVSAGEQPDEPSGSAGDPVRLYPDAYEEVVSVASVGSDGSPVRGSPASADVDLAAPGGGLVSTAPVVAAGTLGHVGPRDDAAAGAAIVAGVAALVLAEEPWLSPAELSERLRRTSHQRPAVGGEPRPGFVNAYGAVMALLTSAPHGGPAAEAFAPPTRSDVTDDERSAMGWALATLAGGAVGAGAVLTVVVGRRRGWTPGGGPTGSR